LLKVASYLRDLYMRYNLTTSSLQILWVVEAGIELPLNFF